MISKLFRPQSPDIIFLVLTLVLIILGLVILSSASGDLAEVRFGSSFAFVKNQIIHGLLFGLLAFAIALFIPHKLIDKLSLPIYLLGLVLLVLVFTPIGIHAGGSDRWLNIFGVNFQPSELVKLTLIIYIASWLVKKAARRDSFVQGFMPLITFLAPVALLLFMQPSTSTALLLILTSFMIYLAGGGRILFLILGVGAGAALITALILLGPTYRQNRIMGYLNPEYDPLGSGYQINQTLIAIGSGGLFGVGYGKSTSKLGSLPEPIGDSIFAVAAEEFGFVGASLLILIFVLFTIRGFAIAKGTKDSFPRLITIGFTTLISFQTFLHIGSVSGLTPFTGVPLPFVSYGGTAMAVLLCMCGIMYRISWKQK